MTIPMLPAQTERDGIELTSQCLAHLRASDHRAALIDGTPFTFSRAATASITDRNGVAVTLPHHVPAFEPRDWLNTSARTHVGWLLGTSDRAALPVLWRPRAFSFYVEHIETGLTSGQALVSITNDAANGGYWVLRRDTNGYQVRHNGSGEVVATLGTAPSAGQRCRTWGYVYEDGAVQLWQSINEAAASNTTRTTGTAFAATWGSGNALLRLCASGTGNYGTAWIRKLVLMPGVQPIDVLQRGF